MPPVSPQTLSAVSNVAPIDFAHLRLQYEILCRPLALLAAEANLSVEALEYVAEQQEWMPLWPEAEEPLASAIPSGISSASDGVSPAGRVTGQSGSPDSPPSAELSSAASLLFGEEPEDEVGASIRQFITRNRQRLAAYQVAKDILLTQRRFSLEFTLLEQAQLLLKSIDRESPMAARDMRLLGSLFKDLHAMSSATMAGGASVQVSPDENGLPQVLIRDLSGVNAGRSAAAAAA